MSEVYDSMKEQSRCESDKERYWMNCACLLDSKIANMVHEVADARRTAEYWKAEHLAGNARLAFQIEENRQAAPSRYADLLRWMRKRAVIPLYVGDHADTLRAKEFVGDELISEDAAENAFKQVWFLDNAPVTQDVKDAIRKAANYGMNRF